MGYWHFAFREAWIGTWELLTGGFAAAMIAVVVFAVTVFFAHRFRGKEEMKEWLWDGVLGLAALITVGVVVFIVELIVVAPMKAHEQDASDLKAEEEIHTQDVIEKTTLDFELTNTKDELSAANARATSLSDSAIRGRADIKDEPIASATAICDVVVQSDKPNAGASYLSPGALIALTQDGRALLVAYADKASSHTADGGKTLEYKIKCSASSDGPWMGSPTGDIGKANILLVHVAKGILPIGSQILSGHIVWVINNEAAQRFEIPPQPAQECESGNASGFGVRLIPGSDFNSLRSAMPSSIPDTLASPH